MILLFSKVAAITMKQIRGASKPVFLVGYYLLMVHYIYRLNRWSMWCARRETLTSTVFWHSFSHSCEAVYYRWLCLHNSCGRSLNLKTYRETSVCWRAHYWWLYLHCVWASWLNSIELSFYNKILYRCPKMHLPDYFSIVALANTFSSFYINKISVIRSSCPSDSHSHVLIPPDTKKVLQNLTCVTADEVCRLVLQAPCKSWFRPTIYLLV